MSEHVDALGRHVNTLGPGPYRQMIDRLTPQEQFELLLLLRRLTEDEIRAAGARREAEWARERARAKAPWRWWLRECWRTRAQLRRAKRC